MNRNTKIILVIAAIVVIYCWYTARKAEKDNLLTDVPQSNTKAASIVSGGSGGGFGGGAYASTDMVDSQLQAAISSNTTTTSTNTGGSLFDGSYQTNQMLPVLAQMASLPSTIIQAAPVANLTDRNYQSGPQVPQLVTITNNVSTAKTVKASTPVSFNTNTQR